MPNYNKSISSSQESKRLYEENKLLEKIKITSSGSGSSTFQNVLTNGSILTTTNTINFQANDLLFRGTTSGQGFDVQVGDYVNYLSNTAGVNITSAGASFFSFDGGTNQGNVFTQSGGTAGITNGDPNGLNSAVSVNVNGTLGLLSQNSPGLTIGKIDMYPDGRIQITATKKAGDPTASDIPSNYFSVYKNTSSGAVKLWYNDGGTMKSVALA